MSNMNMKLTEVEKTKLLEWQKFLEELLEWVSNIDCEEPAGCPCHRIDTSGGEEACMPCRTREAYEKISIKNN